MAPSTSFARLLTSVMVIVIALQGSTASDNQGIIGAKRILLRVMTTTTGTDLLQQRDNGEKRDNSMVGLEAQANEVANLMARDYKGATGPKKKPPINNHEPNN